MKALSETEELDIVTGALCNHSNLCADIFSADGFLLPVVKNKLEELVDFIKTEYLSCFPLLRIKDITLNGSICSYIYTSDSDIDLFVITEEIVPQNKILAQKIQNSFIVVLARLDMKPSFYGHPIDFSIMQESNVIYSHNCYSLLHNCWLQKPERKEFSFTPHELYQAYKQQIASLHQFTDNLPHEKNFLTKDGADAVQKYLTNLRKQAFECKEFSPEHEYAKDYNLYRLLKKFEVWQTFQKYASDSKNNCAV